MKHWLLLLLPLFCIACTDSSTDGAADNTTTQAETTTAVPEETKQAPVSTLVTEVIEYTVNDQPFTG